MDILTDDPNLPLRPRPPKHLKDALPIDSDIVLSVVLLDHPRFAQSPSDVFRRNERLLAQQGHRPLVRGMVEDRLANAAQPPRVVGLSAHLGEGLLGTSNLLLYFAELVTEGNQEFAVASVLAEREHHYTRQVVLRLFDLRKVPGQVVLIVLDFAEHVEEENLHVVSQILMVHKQLRQIPPILTVSRILGPIDLKDRHHILLIAVDLVPGRMHEGTLPVMSNQFSLSGVETEAVLADVEEVEVVVLRRVGTVVPGLHFVAA